MSERMASQSEWHNRSLGDMGEWSGGQTPFKSNPNYWQGGTVLWVSPKDITGPLIRDSEDKITSLALSNTRLRLYPNTSIMIVVRSGILRHRFPVTRCTKQFTVNQDLKVLIPNNEVDAQFIFCMLNYLGPTILRRVVKAGTTVESVDIPAFLKLDIPLPPLPQQRKIARILTTLDNLIEKTEALIAKYQSIKQGMMADLFTRGVDANGKLRPPQSAAPELYKQSELGWIPKEWEVCRVDEVGAVKLGRQRSPDQHSGKHTTPYLRVANVFDGWIDYSDVLEMDFTPTERETFSLIRNDILLNEGQSLELVGRSSMYLGEPNRYCFQNTLVRFRCTPENHPTFWQDCFQYGRSIGRFMQIASQTTSVAHLGADRFARMMVVRPALEEQVAIAKRIRSMNGRMVVEEEQRGKLRTWKTGLMQDLLTGKVPVNPDESEEAVR